jgi:hypothetical protein
MQPVFTREPKMVPGRCGHCGREYLARHEAEHSLCPPCFQAANAVLYRHAPNYNVDTGLCCCPGCASPNVSETNFRTPTEARGAVMALGVAVFIMGLWLFWPVAIVGILIFTTGKYLASLTAENIVRHCNVCGHRWPVHVEQS